MVCPRANRMAIRLTLSPPDGPYGPMKNFVNIIFTGGKIQRIFNVLMAVLYNSLRFHLIYLTMLTSEKRRSYGF